MKVLPAKRGRGSRGETRFINPHFLALAAMKPARDDIKGSYSRRDVARRPPGGGGGGAIRRTCPPDIRPLSIPRSGGGGAVWEGKIKEAPHYKAFDSPQRASPIKRMKSIPF